MAPHATTTESLRMSWEEFLDWSDEDTYAEWVDGEVQPMTAPGTRHQRVLLFLATLLQHFVEAHHLGELFAAPFLVKLPHSGRIPDVLFIAREHLDRLTETYLDGPPDLAVEIISPDSRTRDRRDKHREYQAAGVREYWIIDPERKRAEIHALNEAGKYEILFSGTSGRWESRVLPGLWMQAEWLWQEPLPPLLSVLREWGLV